MVTAAMQELDVFTGAIRNFFAAQVGPLLVEQGVSLNFDILPLTVSAADVSDGTGQYSATRASELFSRFIADHAAHAFNGTHYSHHGSLAQILRFDVFSNANFYARPDASAEVNEAERQRFESYIGKADLLMESVAALTIVPHEYQPSEAIPGNWADPGASANWKVFRQRFASDEAPKSDTPLSPSSLRPGFRLPLRSINLDEIRKYIENRKILPPLRPKFPIPVDGPDIAPPWVKAAKPAELDFRNLDSGVFDARLVQKYLGTTPVNLSMMHGLFDLSSGKEKVVALTHIETVATTPGERAVDLLIQSGTLPDVITDSASGVMDEVKVEFDYQFVQIERPWIFWPLLRSTNWYIRDARRGDLTEGMEGQREGLLRLIPESMIVVRNLRIEAAFSDNDHDAIANSFAVGPFRVTDADMQSGVLHAPGMQVIGFIDLAMPILPPRTDPAIVA